MNLLELKATIAKASDGPLYSHGSECVFDDEVPLFCTDDADMASFIAASRTALPHALQVMEEMAAALVEAEDIEDMPAWKYTQIAASLTAYERFQADVMGEK